MYERKYSLWKYDAVFRFDERERIKTRCTLEKDIMRKKNKTSTKYKLKGYGADKASAIEELKDYRSSVIRKETENGTSFEVTEFCIEEENAIIEKDHFNDTEDIYIYSYPIRYPKFDTNIPIVIADPEDYDEEYFEKAISFSCKLNATTWDERIRGCYDDTEAYAYLKPDFKYEERIYLLTREALEFQLFSKYKLLEKRKISTERNWISKYISLDFDIDYTDKEKVRELCLKCDEKIRETGYGSYGYFLEKRMYERCTKANYRLIGEMENKEKRMPTILIHYPEVQSIK